MRPTETANGEECGSQVNEGEHSSVDGFITGRGSSTAIVKGVLLRPKHDSCAKNGKDDDDRLQRGKETSKQEYIDRWNILITNLEFDVLCERIEFRLVEDKF